MTKSASALKNGWLSASYLKSAREPKSSSWLSAIYLITSRPLPVKAPTTNWGVEGFWKCSRHILSDSTVILNLHFHVWLPLLTPSPPQITRLLFACMQKDIWLCKPLFQFSSFHRACSKFVHLRFELKVENILSDILRNIEKLTITHGRQYLIISQNSVKLPKSARCSSAFSIKIIADEVVSILWERVLSSKTIFSNKMQNLKRHNVPFGTYGPQIVK